LAAQPPPSQLIFWVVFFQTINGHKKPSAAKPEPNQSNKSTAKDAKDTKKKSQIPMIKNTARSASIPLEFGHWDLEFFLRAFRVLRG
jgi:hypothetical protein